MVSAEFHKAVAYALSCVGRHDLTLTVKEGTLVVVRNYAYVIICIVMLEL